MQMLLVLIVYEWRKELDAVNSIYLREIVYQVSVTASLK